MADTNPYEALEREKSSPAVKEMETLATPILGRTSEASPTLIVSPRAALALRGAYDRFRAGRAGGRADRAGGRAGQKVALGALPAPLPRAMQPWLSSPARSSTFERWLQPAQLLLHA